MTIGQTLAQARHDAGLTVADVSERTGIGTSVVDGIEHDDFAACRGLDPRAQIRAIADAVGLHAASLVDEFEAAVAAPAEGTDLVLADDPTEPIPAVTPAGLDQAGDPVADFDPVQAAPVRVRRIRGNWIALMGVVLLGVAVASGYMLTFGAGEQSAAPASATRPTAPAGSSPGPGAASHRSSRPESAGTGGPVRALKVVHIAAFGPGGAGGDSPQLARLALSGTGARPWHSSWYATAHFGNLQSGTGLILDMGRPVTVTSAVIALGNGPGASLELRIGNARTLSGLHRVARVTGAGGVVRMHLKPTQGRYVLVWFTKLPPDHAGTFQASVYKITLLGHR